MMRQYSMRWLLLVGITAAFFAKVSLAAAGAIEDPMTIKAAVKAAVQPRLPVIKGTNIGIEVGSIDPRLQLPECPSVDVTLPPNDAAVMSAEVTCAAPAWAIYVPVHLHAWVEAVVAATNLVPNRALSPRDLTRGRVDMFTATGGVLTDPRQAEGKILRAGLPMGAPILSSLLDLPIAVHRGQKVVLTLRDPTMTIRTAALALEDGRVGDSIEVRNPETQKTLRAMVDSDGGVELKF
ncbi:MAG TPA: flagellar basal body P-ring formation chaperone FlgA [Stellaceae bacterium]|nr:flagellar basal body P-ring formation chaperone FlgA [Stellaceae bacterium]